MPHQCAHWFAMTEVDGAGPVSPGDICYGRSYCGTVNARSLHYPTQTSDLSPQHEKTPPFWAEFRACQKSTCRGDPWSPVDFAKAKSIAARRKYGYFPSENPKNAVFRRAGRCPAPTGYLRKRFFDSLKGVLQIFATHPFCYAFPLACFFFSRHIKNGI